MDKIKINNTEIPVYSYNTVIVGSGAAGLNAAGRLYSLSQRDIAIVTEGLSLGTSRNTGSDKQTYYKLTLSGGEPDSVREMAETLFSGMGMDGDNALCEAALSPQCFLHLCELGVEFPRNLYGEYIGYKTDHDPRRRATSVGPYTSRRMTEALEKDVLDKKIKIYDGYQAVKILTEENSVKGLLCLDENESFVCFQCKNIVYATGGPAGIYANSVYPVCHKGMSGIAFQAGAIGKSLTEWQFGLASVNPRWNVSGTYMQVLPRFISTDENGENSREFLLDFFSDTGDMHSKIFLKGYQWPFDVRKVSGGSSIIDILVYIEQGKGRRVFLDFRENTRCKEPDYTTLSREAFDYLNKAGAMFGKPIDRLLHMNAPAVDFYMDKGVDLRAQPLEIALCAQHNNGGLSVDSNWQTNVKGLFAAGEAAGTHGVYRPGGSALNSGQVGSLRAARYIASTGKGSPQGNISLKEIESFISLITLSDSSNVQEISHEVTTSMSRFAGAIRNKEEITRLKNDVHDMLMHFSSRVRCKKGELKNAYRLYDILTTQYVYLCAMENYIECGGKSRGSALYTDPAGALPYSTLPSTFSFFLSSDDTMIQETRYTDEGCSFTYRLPRPIPEDDDFFENVWREFRQRGY